VNPWSKYTIDEKIPGTTENARLPEINGPAVRASYTDASVATDFRDFLR
jgi:hypothetical protein